MIAHKNDVLVQVRRSQLLTNQMYSSMLADQNRMLTACLRESQGRLLRHQAFIAVMLGVMFTTLVYLVTMEALQWAV